ncbi:hypothetical protein AHAS_Ahas15G0201600 [Arachis hypogaea]
MDAILAQNKMITKQLAELTKQMEKNQAAAIHTQPSPQEELETEEEVNWEEANYLGNSSRPTNDPYSKTYNSGWRNHPNFGWGNQQSQSQNHRPHNPTQYNNCTHQNPNQRPYHTTQDTYYQPPYQSHNNSSRHNFNQPSSQEDERMARMEAMLASVCKKVEEIKKFKEEERVNMSSRGAAIKNLELQVRHLSQQIPKSTDSFPSDNEKNPRGGTQKVTWEECRAVSLASEEVREEEFEQKTDTA